MKKNNKTQVNTPTLLSILLAGMAMILTACQPPSQLTARNNDTILVTVSILPQAYFVERIGGDAVTVNVMVGPGEEPHTYEPRPEQMKALSGSQVFFSIGIEYEEAWLPRFKDVNPDLLFVDSSAGITLIEAAEPHRHQDDENNEEPHDEDDNQDSEDHADDHGLDPHVWLAPANGKIIAANILDTLVALLPDESETLQTNFDALINDIDKLDAQIEETLEGVEQRSFMVFHSAWGYFAEQYDLEEIPVQVGGQEPSPGEMAELIHIARDEQIGVIFIQPTFNSASAEALAQEINAEVAVVDPLARNWLENLEAVAEAFAESRRN